MHLAMYLHLNINLMLNLYSGFFITMKNDNPKYTVFRIINLTFFFF